MSGTLAIGGGCHCRALRYELTWPLEDHGSGPVRIIARRCSCSFCTRIDGVWTSHPAAVLLVKEDPDHPASRYRFGTGTADFLFCACCGVTPLVTSDLDGQCHAVVNANTFDDEADRRYELEVADTSFEGEAVEERLARRRARWIAQVDWVRFNR